jgi:hypothetical protein
MIYQNPRKPCSVFSLSHCPLFEPLSSASAAIPNPNSSESLIAAIGHQLLGHPIKVVIPPLGVILRGCSGMLGTRNKMGLCSCRYFLQPLRHR